jgi:hypothetical protein
MTSFAILLALIAFGPRQSMAKGPGNSGNSGSDKHSNSFQLGSGMQNSDHHNSGSSGMNFDKGMNSGNFMGQGMNSHKTFDANNRPEFIGGNGEGRESSRYRWDNGRWWFWGPGNRWMWYGDDGRWQDNSNAYVVQRPILENFSGDPIKIVNPAKNGVTLNYMLNGSAYTIPPGYSQDLREDRAWVIQFSRGENLDQARYGLQSGVYTFARADHGWELFRSELPQMVAPPAPIAAPTNPPTTAPANPQ